MKITDDTLSTVLGQHDILVVDFWATWCRPCKMFSPILDEISQEYSIWIGKIDIDENPESVQQYGIVSVPTTIVFEKGKPVKTIIGAKPKHQMIEELKQWL